MMLYRPGRAISWAFFKIFCRMEVVGADIPRSGGCLLVANHISHLDPPLVGAAIRRMVYFMAKQELFEIPILGSIIAGTGAFPVKRGTADRGALKRAWTLLRDGNVVCIFPEGRRSPDGTLQSAEAGAALVAAQSNVPVVPLGLIGTADVLPPGGVVLHPHPVKVIVGEPLHLDDLRAEKYDRLLLNEIGRRMMDGIAGAVRQGLNANAGLQKRGNHKSK
ncbi:MAG: lysophospholipid acyltransferase family protein [bacterium]|nr:lysophospholipid acyltransferase family protein [bacterium]